MVKNSDASRAVRKIGTPFYFYDSADIKARYAALRSALGAGWGLYFAAKANPNVEILKIYRALGARVECASAGELLAAQKAGFAPMQTALSGPVKGRREYALIKSKKPSIIHAETTEELNALNSLGGKYRVALRLNVDHAVPKEKGGRIMSGGMDKFGFSTEEATELLRRRDKYKNLEFAGFHFYLGTQLLEPKTWLKGAESYARCVADICRKTSFEPDYINFGGGLGIPYGAKQKEFSTAQFKTGVKRLENLMAGFEELRRAKLYIEPGRYLIGPAGVYVTRVVALKKMRGTDFALTDGGIHHALFPFRVSAEFPAGLVNRKGEGRRRYVIGGPLCTTLDQSDLPLELPIIKTGDLIAIGNSGAYGYSAGMHFFLSHPMPAEVLKDGGEFYIIRKPSASEHLFSRQTRAKI